MPASAQVRCPSGHEHACGRGHRQQGAEGDEDLADQRGLIPGRAVAARHAPAPALVGGHRRSAAAAAVTLGLWLLQRAVDIVELVGGDDLQRSSCLRRPACPLRPSASCCLGRHAPALPAAFGGCSSRIGVGNRGGIAGRHVIAAARRRRTSCVGGLLRGFLRDLPCADRFPSRDLCIDRFAGCSRFPISLAVSELGRYCLRLAPQTTQKFRSQYQGQAPAGSIIIWQSPRCPSPTRKETPPRVHSGQKKGIFGQPGRKQGNFRDPDVADRRPWMRVWDQSML